jgi:hypothetical protein
MKMRIRRSNQPPPAALHVCRESRQVALKKYAQLGGGTIGTSTAYICAAQDTLSQDTLYFPFVLRNHFTILNPKVFRLELRGSIRSIALDSRWLRLARWRPAVSLSIVTLKAQFPSLEELIVVAHQAIEPQYIAFSSNLKSQHEIWRQPITGIEFMEVGDPDVVARTSEKVNGLSGYLHRTTKLGDSLVIKVMLMTRGGKKHFLEKA